jgi:hypothetical protein
MDRAFTEKRQRALVEILTNVPPVCHGQTPAGFGGSARSEAPVLIYDLRFTRPCHIRRVNRKS